MIVIIRGTSDHNDFGQLIQLLDNDLHTRYGTLQAMYDPYNVMESTESVVLAYLDQLPVACGGFKVHDDETVEIKRMYVKPAYRGRGIASRILVELEGWAMELGYARSILETGEKQAEAIGLYQKNGYRQIENYGPYREQPGSVCFEKKLQRNYS